MTFSIIIPVYNAEQYLKQCLDSILNQTFGDVELILVDDGSDDSSPKICDEYARKHDQIKSIHQENAGPAVARNAGFRLAVGKYVLFWDSDDTMAQNYFFEKLYESAKSCPDVILYKHQKVSAQTGHIYACGYDFEGISEEMDVPEILMQLVKNDAFYCAPWAKSIRRDLLVENEICFREGEWGEDMEWYYHIIEHVKRIALIDEVFVLYLVHENSVSNDYNITKLSGYVTALEAWTEKYQQISVDKTFKTAVLASLAKLYCNLLIAYSGLADTKKREFLNRIKKLSHLLKYTQNPRTRVISRVYRVLGFSVTIQLLRLLKKVKQ